MRTRIQALTPDRVAVTATDDTGEPRTTEYFTTRGREHGRSYYVKIDDGRQYPQVCEGLARTGPTLMIHGDRPLVDVIRREYHAGKRALR